MPRVHTALADASWSFGSEEKGVGVAAMRDVTARTIPWIPPTDRIGRGRQVDGIMPAGGLTETTRQTTSAEDPSSDAISFCLPIKWRLPVGTRYGYPKPTHQSGASGGCSCDSRPAEGWTAEAAIAFGEFVQPSTTTLTEVLTKLRLPTTRKLTVHCQQHPMMSAQPKYGGSFHHDQLARAFLTFSDTASAYRGACAAHFLLAFLKTRSFSCLAGPTSACVGMTRLVMLSTSRV